MSKSRVDVMMNNLSSRHATSRRHFFQNVLRCAIPVVLSRRAVAQALLPQEAQSGPRRAGGGHEQVLRAMGHGEGKLSPSDPAPDFQLNYLHSKEKIRLSSFKGKRPVALVFGS